MTRRKPKSSRKLKLPRGVETLKSKPRGVVTKESILKEAEIMRDTKIDDNVRIESMIERAENKLSDDSRDEVVRFLKNKQNQLLDEATELQENIDMMKQRN